ncbi:hypothetical protein PQZ70_00430 [Candidatus Pseudothioglobus singularis]|nr:hypothetical protein [Candidatus Pseudothioglobus singularis]
MNIKKKISQIINNHFADSNYDPKDWQLVLNSCEAVPSIFHLQNTLNYYVSYFSKENSINLSIVLYNNNKAVGVMPLMTYKDEEGEWILSSNGEEIVEPIFIKTLARKVKKRLEAELRDLIYSLSIQLKIKKCKLVNIEYFGLTSWYLMWSEMALESFSTQQLLVDLSLNLEDIHLNFRKSFRPLVNKGLKELNVEVHESISTQMFEKFRLLHKEVAGRSTRPIKSWKEQKKQIDAQESFLVTVSDENKTLIGGGLFVFSRHTGQYCVGAYKRDLIDKPLGHVVQMKAIETFKKNGLRWYELGQKHSKLDKRLPTDKELSISHFKEGFATHVLARQHLVVDFNKD